MTRTPPRPPTSRLPPGRWRGGPRLALALLLLARNQLRRPHHPVVRRSAGSRRTCGSGPPRSGCCCRSFCGPTRWPSGRRGVLIDRFGPRRVLGAAMGLWSAAQAATGLAGGLPWSRRGAARARLARRCSSWSGRGGAGLVRAGAPTATGVFNSASTLGPALAPPIVTALMLAYGWRSAFLATGLAGFVVALLWLGLYRDREAASDEPAAKPVALRLLARADDMGHGGRQRRLGLPGTVLRRLAARLPGDGAASFRAQDRLGRGDPPYVFGFLGSLAGAGRVRLRWRRPGFPPSPAARAPIVAGLVAGGATGLAIFAGSESKRLPRSRRRCSSPTWPATPRSGRWR